MVYQLSSSPTSGVWQSSPAKSPSVPIARRLSRSVPVAAPDAATDVQQRRTSDAGFSTGSQSQRSRFAFSNNNSFKTPAASMASIASAAKPPAGPSACTKVQVGFACPTVSVSDGSSAVAPSLASPGRVATKSSLLSRALLDTPGVTNELYGASAPVQGFSVSSLGKTCADAYC